MLEERAKDAENKVQLLLDQVEHRGVPLLRQRAVHLAPGDGAVDDEVPAEQAALALLATALLVRVDVRRPWAAAGWALSPVLLVHWLSWELVAAVGVAPALGAAGAAYLVSTTVPGLRPEWREMDRSRAQPGVGRE